MRWKLLLILAVPLATIICIFAVRTHRYRRDYANRELPRAWKTIDEVRIERLPLVDALTELSRKSGVRLEADWDALHHAHIGKQALVTLRRRDRHLAGCLEDLLEILNQTPDIPGMGRPPCTWVNRGGVLYLTTPNWPPATPQIRLYDVPLLKRRPTPETYDHTLIQRSRLAAELWTLCEQFSWSIQPSSSARGMWMNNYNGKLLVAATPEGHWRVSVLVMNYAGQPK